ncbi:hypothetical protein DV736_g2315, partial [Chaetothyriales sp. CBS 134916]
MESGEKNWAQEYLINPLTAPQPAEESGPGTSLLLNGAPYTVRPRSPPRRRPSNRLTKANPRKSISDSPPATDAKRSSSVSRLPSYSAAVSSASKETKDSYPTKPTKAYPTPPPSAFPRSSSAAPTTRRSRQATYPPSSVSSTQTRRRTGSLSERFPGDMSHRPLDTLRKEKYTADRSRHSTRKHHIRPDSIDSLDDAGPAAYHHGGPYDSTLFARNNSANSPLDALADSNAEALKATPYEKIIDSVRGHRPLDGVATYAPGETDRNGHTYEYEQGDNMMIADGAGGGPYKRWPGIQYHPDDIKGKGEPSYTIEKALKESSLENKAKDQDGIEMTSNHHHRNRHHRHSEQGRRQSRSGQSSGGAMATTALEDAGQAPQRSGSFKALRRRIGSLQKKVQHEE